MDRYLVMKLLSTQSNWHSRRPVDTFPDENILPKGKRKQAYNNLHLKSLETPKISLEKARTEALRPDTKLRKAKASDGSFEARHEAEEG
ncbi:hypothetical protein GIB67_043230 [Kingdonia uniflora]|uniref:Uncharacterized protein n=1 Tax=Kingdonia uniflora TaxID=39325 RepID=A0A7J7NYX6_9MAGN|nr:hypothetical protein GIB67_043230 [Kingdonia uniflora]